MVGTLLAGAVPAPATRELESAYKDAMFAPVSPINEAAQTRSHHPYGLHYVSMSLADDQFDGQPQ